MRSHFYPNQTNKRSLLRVARCIQVAYARNTSATIRELKHH
ncbi:hypothetical protein [Chlorogloeopsis sp. ULAP02]